MIGNVIFMKKLLSIFIMAAVGIGLIFSWRAYQNQVPTLADMETFDPTRYDDRLTYSLQEFKLKPCDQRWTLSKITYYDETGTIDREERYQLDETGRSYYIAPNGNQIYTVNKTSGIGAYTEYLSDWELVEDCYDDSGRPIYREGIAPFLSNEHDYVRWYYRTDAQNAVGNDRVSALARTSRLLDPPRYEPIPEFVSYYIYTIDDYGNITDLLVGDLCYLKKDADGYLQMIVAKLSIGYYVLRVDSFGRPLWIVNYYSDGTPWTKTVWEYKTLE